MKRALFAAGIVMLVAAFFAFDLGQYLSLDYFKAQRAAIESYRDAHPVSAALGFFGLYVAVTALSLPGAALMTLVAGALFGLLWGTVIVSFASTLGALLAFLSARFLLRDFVQRRFGRQLGAINTGIERDGAFYLFTLRLVPIFPFFVINLLMGLTPLKATTFALVSQIGMLPGTLVYVNAGREIGALESLSGILSPGLIGAFTLLGVFPLLAKRLVRWFQEKKRLERFPRPRQFERNLVVIGAGSAGLVSAYIAATVRAKVTLIEKDKMGGDCLNTGCVPSKAFIRTARLLGDMRRAQDFGLRGATAELDFGEVMARVARVITAVEPHDSVARYEGLGVECLKGEARIVSPYEVEVNGRSITTRAIVIAAGAKPAIPPIEGIETIGYLTSDTVWGLRARPGRFLVLGGGPVGCELAQAFARLGSRVIQVEMLPRILAREDPEVSEIIAKRFAAEGIGVYTGHRALRFVSERSQKALVCEHGGREIRFDFDAVLVAVGREANTAGYGLEALGIPVSPAHTVETNDYLEALYPNIYACGDVAGPYQFTHVASHQAWYAAVNALFGKLRRFKADYSAIPYAVFTDPEIARVGLNEDEAREREIAFEVTRYGLEDLDRAITDSETDGFVKVLTVPGKDRILGVTIVGSHAGEIIGEYITAMRHGLGLNKVLGTIHIYPTRSEANKYAAGVWKRRHAPEAILRLAARYHAFRRGGLRAALGE
ncbi:MAG: FAD-dependent oxidoreductase [Beggiatoa sp.]|nr:FAD-dependent oxidoreductase [Beggiatoa sp.]